MAKRDVSVDKMLVHVGEYDLFQWVLNGIFCVMWLPESFQTLIMYFAALSPDWRCVQNSTVCTFNGTFSSDNDARCKMPRSEWEYTQPKDFSIVTQFDIFCENEWKIHLTTSIIFISWAIGAIVLGWFADNYGRKSVIFPSISVIIIAGSVTSFLPNIYLFLICRFALGFFIPGASIQEFILLNEFVGSKYRPIAGNIMWTTYTCALCLLGLKAYLIRQWKYLYIACTIPYLFVVVFYKFVPESVRWLRLHGKTEKVMQIFERIAYWNKREIPSDVTISSGANNNVPHKSSPLDLFKTRPMAIKTLVQGYSWLVQALVYYGLSLAADDLGGSLYLSFVLVSIVEFPANISTAYFCEKVGRKKTAISGTLCGGISCIIVAFVPNEGDAHIVRIVLGMLGKFFITMSFNTLYTWSVEIYPTNIRSEGIGFLQVASRIGAASSPWIAKGLKAVHKTAPFIVMGVAALLAFGMMFVLPETRGMGIVETDATDEIEEVELHSSEQEKK